MSPTASIAARVAGAVAALGFILGVVDGPIVAVVGALALVAFGRALAAPAGTVFIGPLAFAVVAGATGVVALRWSSLEVPAIRAIQAVLGPTVAVEPRAMAVAAGVAFGAGVVAAGVWLADDLAASGLGRRWRWIEIVTVGLVLATLFAGPEPADLIEAGIAVAAAVTATVLVALVGHVLNGRSARVAGAVTVVAGGLVASAAGVVGSLG